MNRAVILLSTILTLYSCTLDSGVQAVVLWSPDEGVLATGTVGHIPGYDENSQSVEFIDLKENKILLDLWRLKITKSPEERDAFIQTFQPYIHWFAQGLKSITYLRITPDREDYKKDFIPQDVSVKILDRRPGTQAHGIWWYQVLVPEGAIGWVPEDELDIREHIPGLLPAPVENLTLDPVIDKFFKETWRPADLLTQMENHLVDPDDLKDDYLIRGFREDKSVHMALPGLQRTFNYTHIKKLPDRTYSFETTDLRIRFSLDSRSFTAYFTLGEEGAEREFSLMTENLGDIIVRERARNREIFLQLFALGPVLRSPGQGEIYLEKDQSFLWIPSTLAGETNGLPFFQKSYGNRGQVRILLHLGESLRSAGAQGVISLVFEPAPESPVHFVYRMERGGIQLWQSQPPLPGLYRIDTIELGTPSYFFSFSRT